MRKFKIKNVLLSIFLLTSPIFTLFGTLLINAKADIPVPEPHPKNAWAWKVNLGDTLWFEFEVEQYDEYSHDKIHMFKNSLGINILGEYITPMNFSGELYDVSVIDADSVRFNNVTGMVEPDFNSGPIAHFGFNISSSPHEFYQGTLFTPFYQKFGCVPVILPINVTSGILDVEYLGNIINITYLDPLYSDGKINYFDYFEFDNIERRLYFENSFEGYFIDATYDVNGTLETVEYFILQEWWPGYKVEVQEKIYRIFDPDITNEVEWGVDIGYVLYFGENSYDKKFVEKKIEITGFSIGNYEGYWDFDPGNGLLPMSFKEVWANISVWDPSMEEFRFQSQEVVGIANNFYPSLPWQATFPFMPYIFDQNATMEELKFMQNKFTCRYVHLDDFHMDFDGKFLHFEGMNYSQSQTIRGIVDMESGTMKLMQFLRYDNLESIMFEKNFVPLFSGYNNLMLMSEFIHELSFRTQITTTTGGVNLLYAILPVSPVPQRIPYGELLFYTDMMVTNHFSVNSMSMTITLPWDINLNSSRLLFFRWDSYDGFHGNWHEMSEEEINKTVTFDYDSNSVTIEFDMNEPFSNVFALGYESKYDDEYGNGDDEYYEEIPGYDLLILIGIISFTSLALIKIIRKSRVKIFKK